MERASRPQTLWIEALQVCDKTVDGALIVECSLASQFVLDVSCSLRRFGGAMPSKIGNSPGEVGRKRPVIRRSLSCSARSSFLLWELRHQTGEAYSAALKTIASANVLMMGVLAPHDEPARQRRRLLRAKISDVNPRRGACTVGQLTIQLDPKIRWGVGQSFALDVTWVDGLFLSYLGRKRLMLF